MKFVEIGRTSTANPEVTISRSLNLMVFEDGDPSITYPCHMLIELRSKSQKEEIAQGVTEWHETKSYQFYTVRQSETSSELQTNFQSIAEALKELGYS